MWWGHNAKIALKCTAKIEKSITFLKSVGGAPRRPTLPPPQIAGHLAMIFPIENGFLEFLEQRKTHFTDGGILLGTAELISGKYISQVRPCRPISGW